MYLVDILHVSSVHQR